MTEPETEPKTFLGRALKKLAESESSQRKFAASVGLDPATLTALIRHGQPCSPKTLEKLCSNTNTPLQQRYHLLLAHLKDEVARSGLDNRYLTLGYNETPTLEALEEGDPGNASLAIISRASRSMPHLRAVLDNLAELAMRSEAESIDAKQRRGSKRASA